jgi:hypothetical protein
MLEFRYSKFAQTLVNTVDGGTTPKTGDFSVRSPSESFISTTRPEMINLSERQRRAYDMRWNMKGHPALYSMLSRVLGCPAEQVREEMLRLSLEVRYYKSLSKN